MGLVNEVTFKPINLLVCLLYIFWDILFTMLTETEMHVLIDVIKMRQD